MTAWPAGPGHPPTHCLTLANKLAVVASRD